MPLTDKQMDSIACYDIRDGLQHAYRLGLQAGAKRAAEYCDAVAHDYTQEGDNEAAAAVLEVALDIEEFVLKDEAIRAEAGE